MDEVVEIFDLVESKDSTEEVLDMDDNVLCNIID
jgi:hypothetical protein